LGSPGTGKRIELLAKQIRDSIQRNSARTRQNAAGKARWGTMKLEARARRFACHHAEPAKDDDFITRLITVSVHLPAISSSTAARQDIYNV